MPRYKIDPYLFDEKEIIVLNSLEDNDTPLKISRETALPRSTIYFILNKLKKRGLVKKCATGSKKAWEIKTLDINILEHESKLNSQVNIYSDKKSLKKFLGSTSRNLSGRLRSLNGDNITEGWNKSIGREDVFKHNNLISKNRLISETIFSHSFLNRMSADLGENWKKSFINKPTEYHFLNEKYTNHGAQLFLKDDKVFLIDMDAPLVLEIKNDEIIKMFESLFRFIKDNTGKAKDSL